MHELYLDCVEAWDLLNDDEIPAPPWILDVLAMPIVNNEIPSDHRYERPAA